MKKRTYLMLGLSCAALYGFCAPTVSADDKEPVSIVNKDIDEQNEYFDFNCAFFPKIRSIVFQEDATSGNRYIQKITAGNGFGYEIQHVNKNEQKRATLTSNQDLIITEATIDGKSILDYVKLNSDGTISVLTPAGFKGNVTIKIENSQGVKGKIKFEVTPYYLGPDHNDDSGYYSPFTLRVNDSYLSVPFTYDEKTKQFEIMLPNFSNLGETEHQRKLFSGWEIKDKIYQPGDKVTFSNHPYYVPIFAFYKEDSYRWLKDDGKWYYMNENGNQKVGWLKDGNSWYYLQEDGSMQTGWLKDGSSWYYLSANGSMKTGWLKDNNKWYYLAANGSMKTGWLKENNKWYYLTANGSMATGWCYVGNKWYYLKSNGVMAEKETLKVNGQNYKFNASGHWVK